MIKKIDLSKIRGAWRQRDEYGQDAGGDDTVESLKIIAEKVNELVEWIESKIQGITHTDYD